MNQVVFANYGHFLWKTFNLHPWRFKTAPFCIKWSETGEFDDEGNIEHTLQILPEFDVLTKILLAKRAAKKWKQMLSKDSRENQIIEIWSAEDEEQLDALGGIFGFGKRTRAKKRKSKAQNSKTRARVFWTDIPPLVS
jgi:hypothetical protein